MGIIFRGISDLSAFIVTLLECQRKPKRETVSCYLVHMTVL